MRKKERKTITAFSITKDQLARLDAMAGTRQRSAFLCALIEAEWERSHYVNRRSTVLGNRINPDAGRDTGIGNL